MTSRKGRTHRVKATPEIPTVKMVSAVICRATWRGNAVRDLHGLRDMLAPYAKDHARVDNGTKLLAPGVFILTVSWALSESKSGVREFPCGLIIQVLRGADLAKYET